MFFFIWLFYLNEFSLSLSSSVVYLNMSVTTTCLTMYHLTSSPRPPSSIYVHSSLLCASQFLHLWDGGHLDAMIFQFWRSRSLWFKESYTPREGKPRDQIKSVERYLVKQHVYLLCFWAWTVTQEARQEISWDWSVNHPSGTKKNK